jgi:hypothetical protein
MDADRVHAGVELDSLAVDYRSVDLDFGSALE